MALAPDTLSETKANLTNAADALEAIADEVISAWLPGEATNTVEGPEGTHPLVFELVAQRFRKVGWECSVQTNGADGRPRLLLRDPDAASRAAKFLELAE